MTRALTYRELARIRGFIDLEVPESRRLVRGKINLPLEIFFDMNGPEVIAWANHVSGSSNPRNPIVGLRGIVIKEPTPLTIKISNSGLVFDKGIYKFGPELTGIACSFYYPDMASYGALANRLKQEEFNLA
ncbi:hypothetical protein FJZ17_00490 [Candidatus Pacearchaeota archaeon]|nr:hypothetical protein [Candidatus Pacearchaeota archaeon]